MSTIKRRAVCSFENMSDEVAAAFSEKYPKGYSDYFPDLVKYDKPDGTSFYAVTVEIPDAIYLVKIQVKTDDAEIWSAGLMVVMTMLTAQMVKAFQMTTSHSTQTVMTTQSTENNLT